ncbi:MAG TPA: N-acetyltransferase [Anaerolineales bacterium]|nr:N-acetyltransferase [Anaerolineales bacterium]
MKESKLNILIRTETSLDIDEISRITYAAFLGKFSDHPTEHLIVNGLREAGTLSLSLVAELDRKIVGLVAFSPVTINDIFIDWYGLGPISVAPGYQKQGIGSKLIREGLTRLRELGARGCVLEGSPAYYQRFGFKPIPGLTYHASPAPEFFMALPFGEDVPLGKVEYHRAFYVSA